MNTLALFTSKSFFKDAARTELAANDAPPGVGAPCKFRLPATPSEWAGACRQTRLPGG